MKIRIGTRGSKLALLQTESVKKRLEDIGIACEISIYTTSGDRVKKPLYMFGGKGAFVRELEKALIEGEIDIAVHSLKDLPTQIPDPLEIAAVPEREDPRDALLSRDNLNIFDIPKDSILGTGSPRRIAQLKLLRPDLKFKEIRGNVDTRIKKMEKGEFFGIVLAVASIKRLGMDSVVSQIFDEKLCVPAAGQGALAIECKRDRKDLKEILDMINDKKAFFETYCERDFLKAYGGGCHTPLGVLAKIKDGTLNLSIFIEKKDGATLKLEKSCEFHLWRDFGKKVAHEILEGEKNI